MGALARDAGRRLLEYGGTFLAAVGINFLLPHLAPGDPLIYVIGPEATELSPAERRQLVGDDLGGADVLWFVGGDLQGEL